MLHSLRESDLLIFPIISGRAVAISRTNKKKTNLIQPVFTTNTNRNYRSLQILYNNTIVSKYRLQVMLVLCFKLFLQVIGLLSKDIPIVSYIMGCFWSNEADARERYHYQPRGIKKTHTARQPDTSRIRPLFGEYRCTCRRFWASRLSWPNMYQVCKKCGNHVYAHTQREVRPSDTARDRTGTREHQQDYCQMCQHLGQYCGNIRRMR